MNACDQAERQAGRVSAYHDGQLPPGERAAFEQHLGQCPACAAELARMRKLSTLIRGLAGPQLSPAGLARLHASINRQPKPGILRFAEALGALAAMILLACVLRLSQQTPTSSIVEPAPTQEATAVPAWQLDAVAPPPGELVADDSVEPLVDWTVQELSGKDEAAHD